MHQTNFLPALLALFALLLVTGCAQESQPYSEQTNEIDPAMNIPEPPMNSSSDGDDADTSNPPSTPQPEKVELTDEQWKQILSEDEFYVLRRSGTERPGSHKYNHHPLDKPGSFHCVGCGNKLYDAKHKFHSGCGWPSFNQAAEPGAITEHVDKSIFPYRVEMRCARCDGHLGHIFEDGHLWDQKTGKRHCVNGTAIIFVPKGKDPKDVIAEHRKKFANQ